MKRTHIGEEQRSTKRVRIDTNQDATDSKKPTDDQNFNIALRRSFNYISQRTKIDKPPGHIYGVVKMIYALESKFSVTLSPSVDGKRDDLLEVVLSKLHLENLGPLRIGDKVRISLKGARIEKTQKRAHIPVKLFFTEGYHIRYGELEINTFIAPPAPKTIQAETPAQDQVEPISTVIHQPVGAVPSPAPPGMSKKEKKRRKSHSKELQANQKSPAEPAKKLDALNTVPPVVNTPTSNAPPQLQGKQEARPAPLNVLQPPGEYMALSSFPTKLHGSAVYIIGVVLWADESKQARGGDRDWMKCLRIADCTNFDLNDSCKQGVIVNLFAGKENLLPDPGQGDIIILKQIKISAYNGNINGVGYRNRYSWAIYSKEKREVSSSVDQPAPTAETSFALTQGNPPTPSNITYCEKLLDWWLVIQKQQEEEADKTRVGPAVYGPVKRVHTLICDLEERGPRAVDGYFDCTVEIIRNYTHDNGIYTIWVTDYTKNSAGFPIEGDWCPTALAGYVFRIEMWDGAAEKGPEMKEGTFYSLGNVRTRINSAGYLEGKLVETKIGLLDEATDESRQLKALLQRKKAWAEETRYIADCFEDKLFKDAPVGGFFHCTVEIVHAEYREGRSSTVYCTDYTSRSDFGGIPAMASWATKSLKDRIAKFTLSDGQSIFAQTIKPGDFCRFKNMRFRKDQEHGYVFGIVGGTQDLIQKLNPRNKENKLLQDLFERKESPARIQLPSSTFQEILDLNQFPEKYRVFGHVVAYEPKNLDDAVTIRCGPCDRQLGKLEKMCLECESDKGLGPICNIYLTMQDKDLNEVVVSISEKSLVFQGLALSTFLDESGVRQEFQDRLKALIGNFYPSKSAPKELNGPTICMEVIAWLHEGDVAFSLLNANPMH